MSGLYLVWSNQHRAWWRPNSAGYTKSVVAAGVYSRGEALSISHDGRDGWTGDTGVPDELPVCIDDLPRPLRDALRSRTDILGVLTDHVDPPEVSPVHVLTDEKVAAIDAARSEEHSASDIALDIEGFQWDLREARLGLGFIAPPEAEGRNLGDLLCAALSPYGHEPPVSGYPQETRDGVTAVLDAVHLAYVSALERNLAALARRGSVPHSTISMAFAKLAAMDRGEVIAAETLADAITTGARIIAASLSGALAPHVVTSALSADDDGPTIQF